MRSVRPALPPLMAFSAMLWIAAGIMYGAADGLSRDVILPLAVAFMVGAIILIVAVYAMKGKPLLRMLALVVLGCCIGCACGSIRSEQVECAADEALALRGVAYTFRVTEDGRAGEYGHSCIARVTASDGTTFLTAVRYPKEEGMVWFGDTFVAHSRFSHPSGSSRDYYRKKGVSVVATVDHFEKRDDDDIMAQLAGFRKKGMALFDEYEGSGQALLRAIVFGDRTHLETNGFYHAVKTVGLAHVVAVSGAHTAIVCSLIGAFLRVLRIPRKPVIVLQVGFVVAYLICTGMPISGIRAAIMTVVALGSLFARRRSSTLAALSVCISGIIVVSPEAAVSISFTLSVLATLGIVAFGSLFREWCERLVGHAWSWLCEPIALTASSGILTMPLAASLFSQIPLIAPLSNIVVTPVFALFCGGGLAVSMICIIDVASGRWLLDILVVVAQGFCEAIEALSALPFAAIPCALDTGAALGISMVIATALWLRWPDPPRWMLTMLCALGSVCLAAFLVVLPRPVGDEVIMLDVGQGDAFVIRSKGSTVLVDTGNQDGKLLEALARNGVFALDGVIITHADDDHCGSITALKGIVRVDEVYVAQDLLSCSCVSCTRLRTYAAAVLDDGEPIGLAMGDELEIGSFSLEVIWPDRFAEEGGNADSLTMLLRSDLDDDGTSEWRGLFCGDAEDAQVDAMIVGGRLGSVDLYKVGHHGSKAALDSDTAQKLSPSVSLISAGEDNRYGHPATQTLEVLTTVGSRIFRTDEMGDVVCKMTLQSITVETLR